MSPSIHTTISETITDIYATLEDIIMPTLPKDYKHTKVSKDTKQTKQTKQMKDNKKFIIPHKTQNKPLTKQQLMKNNNVSCQKWYDTNKSYILNKKKSEYFTKKQKTDVAEFLISLDEY